MKHGLNTDYEENVAVARWRTTQYQERLEQTRNILCSALNQKHTIDWEKLTEEYSLVTPKPEVPIYYECCPPEPQLASPDLPKYIEFPQSRNVTKKNIRRWAIPLSKNMLTFAITKFGQRRSNELRLKIKSFTTKMSRLLSNAIPNTNKRLPNGKKRMNEKKLRIANAKKNMNLLWNSGLPDAYDKKTKLSN
jgi:hypothetical protein